MPNLEGIDSIVDRAKSIFDEGKRYEEEDNRCKAFRCYKTSFQIIEEIYKKGHGTGFRYTSELGGQTPLFLKVAAHALTSYDGSNPKKDLSDMISKYNYVAIEYLRDKNVKFSASDEPYLFFKDFVQVYTDVFFGLKWSSREYHRWPEGVKNDKIQAMFDSILQSDRVIRDPKAFKA